MVLLVINIFAFKSSKMTNHSIQEMQEGDRANHSVLHETSNGRPFTFEYDKRKEFYFTRNNIPNKL